MIEVGTETVLSEAVIELPIPWDSSPSTQPAVAPWHSLYWEPSPPAPASQASAPPAPAPLSCQQRLSTAPPPTPAPLPPVAPSTDSFGRRSNFAPPPPLDCSDLVAVTGRPIFLWRLGSEMGGPNSPSTQVSARGETRTRSPGRRLWMGPWGFGL